MVHLRYLSQVWFAVLASWVLCFGHIALARAEPVNAQTSLPASAVSPNQSIESITPADVLVHVARVRAELELIRDVMGKPKSHSQSITVQNVAPREVFFQALTLFKKVNRLSFEQTRVSGAEPDTPADLIQPSDVYKAVDASLKLIKNIKSDLGIDREIIVERRDPSKQPSDVFLSILEANRQLNVLLDRSFAPSDVYQRVSYAISYTTELLSRFPGTRRTPEIEPLEQSIRPNDVYRRLIQCSYIIRDIGAKSGLTMARLESTELDAITVTPSDVYDIASLVVSELAYLYSASPDRKVVRKAYNPGRKFPSHVFQRVGALESLLKRLSTHADEIPGWLQYKQAEL